jgi:hypothetical protein
LGKKRCWRSPGAAKRCRHCPSPTPSPLGCWQREQPFANRTTMLLAKGLLSQQPYSAVGEDCSLPTTCACCWQRIFIFFEF